MSEKSTSLTRSPRLPDRHPIQDFFICDVTDAIPKDDMGSMEHPIFEDHRDPVEPAATYAVPSRGRMGASLEAVRP